MNEKGLAHHSALQAAHVLVFSTGGFSEDIQGSETASGTAMGRYSAIAPIVRDEKCLGHPGSRRRQ